MKVSIIIVSYNNEIWVEQCLDSLLTQEYRDIEVIWVDNGSKDRTVELVQSSKYAPLQIKLLQLEGNPGFAGGNNAGFEASDGDILFLLNSDARIEKDTITKVVATFQSDREIGVIQNKILLMDDPEKLDGAGSMFTITGFLKHVGYRESKEMTQSFEIFAGKGASLFIRREVAESTYLFNPNFASYFEDSDICWRSWIVGKKVIFSPEGITYHKGGATGLKLRSGTTDFNSFKNRIQTLMINLQKRNLWYILPINIILSFGIAMMYLVRGHSEKAKAVIRGILWPFGHINDILSKRKLVQSKRVYSDKEIFARVMQNFSISYAVKNLIGYTKW